MHIKDYNDAMKFFRTYDNVASKGKWKEFVDEMEFDSIAQGPRTTAADGGRIGYADKNAGKLVKPFSHAWDLPIPKGYVTANQLAEELGVAKLTLKKYRTKGATVDKYPLKGFIDETFKPIRGPGNYTYYLKPTEKMLDNYSIFKNKTTISRDLLKDVETLHNSKLIKDLRKSKKKVLPTLEEVVKVLGKDVKAHGRAANAMATLSKMYKGEEYRLLKLPKNEKLGEFMFKALRQGGKHNPYKQAFYQLAIGEIDKTLGNEVGTLKNFKRYFKDNLTKYLGKGHGMTLNEVASISGMVRNDMAAYGAFVDLTKTKINNGLLANFQGSLSDALNDIDKLKGSEKKLAIKNFNESTLPKAKKKIAANYGDEIAESIRFTEIVPGTKLTDTYKAKDLATWKKKHSIDLKALAKQKGYHLDVKGARPFTEFLTEGKIDKAGMTKFKNTFFKTYQNAGIGKNCKAYGGRVGFQDAGAVGVSKCMNNAIQEHNKNLQSENPVVRNKARSKQFNINKSKNMKSILDLGGKGINRALRFGKAWGAEWEPIFEGAFYEWARRKGLKHDLAKEETFFWKMLDPDTKTGLMEGAEPLLEKELYTIRGENEFIDVDNRPPMQDPEFGKVIGERGTVKRYIDNEKALMAARQKYNQLHSDYNIARTGREQYPEKLEGFEKAMEKKWEEINSLEDKLDLDRDTYQAAVEKQQTELGVAGLKYGEYGSGDTEKLVKQRERRRQREMEDKFPTLTKYEINKKLEDVGLYTDPNLSYKAQTVKRPKGLKRLKGWTTEEAGDYFKDLDKSAYYADNFRMEKATGGIMNLKKKW